MYFSTINLKNNYFFQVFLLAFLGYNLFYLFGIVQQQLVDVWYTYGLFLHFPVWFLVLMLSGILIKKQLNYRLLIIGSAVSILTILVLLHFFNQSIFNSDYTTMLFYVMDYLFCFTILSYWKTRVGN